jgi:basic membrane protein A and related proteins
LKINAQPGKMPAIKLGSNEMKRRSFLAGTALAGTAMSLGLARSAMAQDKPKVAFVLVGPKNDGGWSQHHYEAATKAQEHFGDAVEIVVQESVPEGADAERVMTQLAPSGSKLIFTTSFGFMEATVNVAGKFPDVKFEHATGYKTADNLSVYNARFYEGRAVTGFLAGKMTKTNKIGYIGSFPIPEVIQGINSTFIHARKANPDVDLSVVWLSTWFDPAKEADATQALIDQGVDVVLAHTDSTAPLATLQKSGGLGFGQSADMAEYAPTPRISSIIDNWAPYYIERIQALVDGTWTSVNSWQGIGDGMVGIGEISDAVPADIKTEAEALRDSIANGTYHPFTGPLNKQDGSAWLADGEVADDGTLAGMGFYVEGVKGDIPS